MAAKSAGLRIRLAIENDKHAADTYRKNLCCERSAPIVINDDITVHDANITYREIFSDSDQCDIMLGGPPCQGFSTHRIKGAGVDDARNDLIHIYFDFVRAFAPSMFLMENVPGMLWDRHASSLDRFYIEGARAGYLVQNPVIVDARDYGVPQRRKRVFILGIRQDIEASDLEWPPKPTHGNDLARQKNPALEKWVDCGAAFVPAKPGDVNDVHMNHTQEVIDAFQKTPPNGGSRHQSGRILECHKNHDGHKDVYGRIDPQLPAPTMTTACINPSKGRFVHPTKHHGITVRQAARIQTFPDSYEFIGGLMAAGKQVGNAVPVELGRQLIAHLKPTLARARETRSSSKHVGYGHTCEVENA